MVLAGVSAKIIDNLSDCNIDGFCGGSCGRSFGPSNRFQLGGSNLSHAMEFVVPCRRKSLAPVP